MKIMLLLLFLVVLVAVSSVAVIVSKHQSRAIVVQLRQLEQEIDALNLQWSQLQLEYSSWALQRRVETVAVEKLGLRLPTVSDMERLP